MTCSTVHPLTNKYPLAENEELASNMVTLKPTGGRDIEFEVHRHFTSLGIVTLNAGICT